jgi:uncharacterized protein YbjT (DUF2867 family)
MKRVLVIGASGTVGRQVVFQLRAKGAQIQALTCNLDASRLPPSSRPSDAIAAESRATRKVNSLNRGKVRFT